MSHDCDTCRWHGLGMCWAPPLKDLGMEYRLCSATEWCGMYEPSGLIGLLMEGRDGD